VLSLFRSYNPYSVIVLFLFAILFKMAILIQPEAVFTATNSQIVWIKIAGFLEKILGNAPFLITFFALANTFGQAIYLNRIANRHHLFPKTTYLPALGYILITSLLKEWNYLSAALVSNWLILAMLSSLLQLYNAQDARKQIFNIGCFISLMSLLVFPNIIFIALLLLALAILRPFKAAEWMVGLLGILTPFYFLAGLLFLFDALPLLERMIAVGFSLPKQIREPAITLTGFSVLLVLLVTGMYYLNIFMGRMLIQNKKWWWVIIAGFVISLIAGVFTVARGYNQWMAMLVPATLIISNMWFEERRKWITSLSFYLLLAVVIFVQWFPVTPARKPANKTVTIHLNQPDNGFAPATEARTAQNLIANSLK
jgi:hypothetical protein